MAFLGAKVSADLFTCESRHLTDLRWFYSSYSLFDHELLDLVAPDSFLVWGCWFFGFFGFSA